MLQQDEPDDFVLATGVKISVRKFIEMCFNHVGIAIKWEGSGVNEKGFDASNNKILVEIDPQYFRPAEVDLLVGDASKAKEKLGWVAKTSVEELAKEMMDSDIEMFKRDKYLIEGGHKTLNFHE
jgi:GDPmannose 4,6-dehydratase